MPLCIFLVVIFVAGRNYCPGFKRRSLRGIFGGGEVHLAGDVVAIALIYYA